MSILALKLSCGTLFHRTSRLCEVIVLKGHLLLFCSIILPKFLVKWEKLNVLPAHRDALWTCFFEQSLSFLVSTWIPLCIHFCARVFVSLTRPLYWLLEEWWPKLHLCVLGTGTVLISCSRWARFITVKNTLDSFWIYRSIRHQTGASVCACLNPKPYPSVAASISPVWKSTGCDAVSLNIVLLLLPWKKHTACKQQQDVNTVARSLGKNRSKGKGVLLTAQAFLRKKEKTLKIVSPGVTPVAYCGKKPFGFSSCSLWERLLCCLQLEVLSSKCTFFSNPLARYN